jgi:GntR family transcriptional repressor for pyruvate dehydrogenase complex
MEPAFTSVSVTRSYEHIVRQIHDAIRNGHLARGAKLPTERDLSETFGVSRSVVREAVKVLVAQGIVESRQGSGTFVLDSPVPFVSRTILLDVPVEESAIEQLMEFREALDTLAAHRAATRGSDEQVAGILQAARDSQAAGDNPDAFGEADLRFHMLIDQASDNIYVAIASSSVRKTQGELTLLFASELGSMQIASAQHVKIAEAIRDGDAELAAKAMAEHVRYSGTVALQIPKDVRKQIHASRPRT